MAEPDAPSKLAPPSGVDAPPPSELEGKARELLATLRRAEALPARDRPAAVRDAAYAFQRAAAITTDGVYGPATRRALARALSVSERELPASIGRGSSSSSAPADTDDVPAWLPVAASLARWTQDARASESVASRELARLAPHAAAIAPLTRLSGIVVGEVPGAPSDDDASSWARAAWAGAREAGASARAELASHARQITTEAERALVNVRRALDREADETARGVLVALEATLTAILRPAARAIATATRPLGAGALVIGLAALVFLASSRR